MRVSWHRTQRKLVVSHWHGSVCTASTLVEVKDIPDLISALVAALGEAASTPAVEGSSSARGGSGRLLTLLRWPAVLRRLRGELGVVVAIPQIRPGTPDGAASLVERTR